MDYKNSYIYHKEESHDCWVYTALNYDQSHFQHGSEYNARFKPAICSHYEQRLDVLAAVESRHCWKYDWMAHHHHNDCTIWVLEHNYNWYITFWKNHEAQWWLKSHGVNSKLLKEKFKPWGKSKSQSSSRKQHTREPTYLKSLARLCTFSMVREKTYSNTYDAPGNNSNEKGQMEGWWTSG